MVENCCKYTLIAECGATKSRWALIDNKSSLVVTLGGINVSTMKKEDVEAVVRQAAQELGAVSGPGGGVSGGGPAVGGVADDHLRVCLYLAGVLDAERRAMMEDTVRRFFPCAEQVSLEGDLIAAARAVCGHSEGLVAILGTGANSCRYDGRDIVEHINSGGFILGDEGSASALGRLFIADHIKGLVPSEIDEEFCARFDGSYAGIVAAVYGKSTVSPSAYLGSLCPFILEHYAHPYIKNLVDSNFCAFFERCILRYTMASQMPLGAVDGGSSAVTGSLPLGIVGGFGYACRDILTRLAAEYGITISAFLADPLPQLIEYHK